MTIDDLSARLGTLERQNRKMRAWGGVALLLGVAAAGMGQAAVPPKVIRAERFEVVDGDGKTRGWFEGSPDGSTSLTILRPEQHARVDGPEFARAMKEGPSRGLTVGIDAKGHEQVTMGDKAGNLRGVLAVGWDGAPAMILYGESMSTAAGLAGLHDTAPQFSIQENGKLRVVLGVRHPINSFGGGAIEGPSRSELVMWDEDESAGPVFRAPSLK